MVGVKLQTRKQWSKFVEIEVYIPSNSIVPLPLQPKVKFKIYVKNYIVPKRFNETTI